MRTFVVGLLLLSCGCGPRLVFNPSQELSAQQMLQRADLVFIGVIRKHQIDSQPLFHGTLPGIDPERSKYWRILRREICIETLLRGVEPRKVVDVYEFFWTGATTGDWNSTQNGERALFLVRKEDGRYHVVRDWWRSIFPVTSGPHHRLPLDEAHPPWERIALMNWWIERADRSAKITYPYFHYNDPAGALTLWRVVKLSRGLVRHPSPAVRVAACRELLLLSGWGQDECWESLSDTDREHLSDSGSVCCSADEILAARLKLQQRSAEGWWQSYSAYGDRESRRLLTAINYAPLRTRFCDFWHQQYPEDHDNGCPANQPPPATIVTAQGDIPLIGAWPRQ